MKVPYHTSIAVVSKLARDVAQFMTKPRAIYHGCREADAQSHGSRSHLPRLPLENLPHTTNNPQPASTEIRMRATSEVPTERVVSDTLDNPQTVRYAEDEDRESWELQQ